MRRIWTLMPLLLSASFSTWAGEAEQWLDRMNQAIRQTNYIGTFVYTDRQRMETLRLFHAVENGVERERLISLTGEPREVVRTDSQVTCVGSAPVPRTYVASGSPLLPGGTPSPSSQYRLVLGAADRIAGRTARILEIRATDAYRYGYRLWLDEESGMLLRSLRMGMDGIPVEQLMFTDIRLHEKPAESDLAAAAAAPATDTTIEAPRPVGAIAPSFRISDVPPGFNLILLHPATAGNAGEHQVYSDGIAHVSVYVEQLTDSAAPIPAPSTQGPFNTFARHLGPYRVYVIGDVPQLTAQRFAQGVSQPRER